MSYPKWKYHKTETAKIVNSEEEESALGKGWGDSPADFHDQESAIESSDEESPKKSSETKLRKNTKGE
jgi:hypothetical protein